MIYQNFQQNTSAIISSTNHFWCDFLYSTIKLKHFYGNITNKWNILLFDHREYRFLKNMLLRMQSGFLARIEVEISFSDGEGKILEKGAKFQKIWLTPHAPPRISQSVVKLIDPPPPILGSSFRILYSQRGSSKLSFLLFCIKGSKTQFLGRWESNYATQRWERIFPCWCTLQMNNYE